MNDKKQIEEMKKHINNAFDWGYKTGESDIAKVIAEELVRYYQPKLSENAVVLTEEELKKIIQEEYQNALKDKVVLTKEEINDIKVNYFNYGAEQGYEKGRLLGSKATAKEILDKVSKHYGGAWLVELYKEYGVEVE